MDSLTLHYYRWYLWKRKKVFPLPTAPKECDAGRLVILQEAINQGGAAGKVHAIRKLLDLEGGYGKLVFRISPEEVFFIGEKLQWAWKTSLVHDEQKIPFLDLGENGKLYGPDTRLANASFIEFAYADDASGNYAKTQEEKYLDELVAILYRLEKPSEHIESPDFDGERRIPFHTSTLEGRKALVQTLPLAQKQVIWKFFLGCKRYLVKEAFPDIFPEGGESSEPQRETPYARIQLEVAKSGALGDLDKVQQQNVYNVFALWRDMIKK